MVTRPSSTTRSYVAVTTILLMLGALYLTRAVTAPLAFALFVIVLAWPLQRRLENHCPRWLATTVTLLLCVIIVALFAGALVLSGNMIAQRIPDYAERFDQIYQSVQKWAEANGLPFPAGPQTNGALSKQAVDVIPVALRQVSAFLGFSVLMVAFFILGLLEVQQTSTKFNRKLSGHNHVDLVSISEVLMRKYQAYFLTRTLTSGITGVLSGLLAWVVGLDFAFAWGLLSFLLNYIPTLGSLVAIACATLFALFQFQSFSMAILVCLGLAAIQIVLGSYVDPRLQGRTLSLSPLVVLFSIAFWGLLWGIPGALLGIPLTVGIVIVCDHFERVQWLSVLLSDAQQTNNHDERA